MRPPPRHASFFSSLRRVEERLQSEENKAEQQKRKAGPSWRQPSSPTNSAVHLSPPLHLHCHHPGATSTPHESDPPQEFLSQSIDFPPTPQEAPPLCAAESDPVFQSPTFGGDDISRLLGLLGISVCEDESGDNADVSEFSDSGFYSKVAGLKGPKSGKEVKRMDGWIRYMFNDGGGEKREPLRLAHLLLGKAAFFNRDGFEGIEFPATVEEFLQNDPPV